MRLQVKLRCVRLGSLHSKRSIATANIPQVKTLPDGSVECFKHHAFDTATPAMLPRGHFMQMPALTRWFSSLPGHGKYELDSTYLEAHREVIVPLEMTTIGSQNAQETFHRLNAPLGQFLDWTKIASDDSRERLYLAQAQLIDLPESLRKDFPTPDLVMNAGKGDVYDTNVWIGKAPTYTPLHRDPNPNLFVQLVGSKVVRVFPPQVGATIFAEVQRKLGTGTSSVFRGEEMMAGPEKQLLEEEVWSAEGEHKEHVMEAVLERGDGMFIPKGWWHSIKGIGKGVTGSVNWWFR